ncbi:MAG: hypothetical protein H6983_14565 [Ectothiorhodospiraceae bacterium]|nr:hypothetical protein [Ectothiorhodospiraceae bacterium]
MTIRATSFLAAVVAAALLAAPQGRAWADPASHERAARAFYEQVSLGDADAVSQVVADMILQLQPGLTDHRAVIAEYAREVVVSPEYVNRRVQIFVEMFSEEELETLTWLFGHETFRKYRERRVELVRRNSEETMALFRSRLPELQRRIQAARPGQVNQGQR